MSGKVRLVILGICALAPWAHGDSKTAKNGEHAPSAPAAATTARRQSAPGSLLVKIRKEWVEGNTAGVIEAKGRNVRTGLPCTVKLTIRLAEQNPLVWLSVKNEKGEFDSYGIGGPGGEALLTTKDFSMNGRSPYARYWVVSRSGNRLEFQRLFHFPGGTETYTIYFSTDQSRVEFFEHRANNLLGYPISGTKYGCNGFKTEMKIEHVEPKPYVEPKVPSSELTPSGFASTVYQYADRSDHYYSSRFSPLVGKRAYDWISARPGAAHPLDSIGDDYAQYPKMAHTKKFQAALEPVLAQARKLAAAEPMKYPMRRLVELSAFRATKSSATGEAHVSFAIPVAVKQGGGKDGSGLLIWAYVNGHWDSNEGRNQLVVDTTYTSAQPPHMREWQTFDDMVSGYGWPELEVEHLAPPVQEP